MNTRNIISSLAAVFTSAVMVFDLAAVVNAESEPTDSDTNRDATVTLDDIGCSPAEILSNADSGFLFYDQLDANNMNSYDAMETYLAAPSDTSLTIKLTDDIVLERSSRNMSNWSDDEYTEYANAILGAVMPGVIACTLDYPELFWLNFAEVGCSMTTNGVSYSTGTTKKWSINISEISLSPNFDTNYSSFDEVMQILDSVNEAIEAFPVEGDTNYEKCKSIYQSIIDITTYDTTAPYAHGIAGILYDTNAVCEGYSKTFKILCDRENIPCISVLGNYNETTLTAHMWNYVFLDGAWYACDSTYDESVGDFTYFMKGSEFFNKNHTPESPYSIIELSFPELSVEDYIPDGSEVSTTTTTTTTTTAITTTTTASSSESTETTYTTTTTVSSSSTTEKNNEITTTSVPTETTTTTASDTSHDESTETTTTTTSSTTAATTTTSATSDVITTTSSTTAATEEPVPLYGDVNNDGIISLLDAVLLRKYLVGADIDTVAFGESFDCNGDGSVNIFDAAFLMKMLLQ